jgi:hypothetical protein
MPFIVGVSPQVGSRCWREVLIAVTLTHLRLLPESEDSKVVPFIARYSSMWHL